VLAVGLFLRFLPGLLVRLRVLTLPLRLLAVQAVFVLTFTPTLLLMREAVPLVTSQQSLFTAALMGLALPSLLARHRRFRDRTLSFGDRPEYGRHYQLAEHLLGPAPTPGTLVLAGVLLFPVIGLGAQSLTSLLLFHLAVLLLTLLAGLFVALYNTGAGEPGGA